MLYQGIVSKLDYRIMPPLRLGGYQHSLISYETLILWKTCKLNQFIYESKLFTSLSVWVAWYVQHTLGGNQIQCLTQS